jgi:hypothetical protein
MQVPARLTALRAASWLIFLGAAALALHEPLGGDQYFFLYGARSLAEGSVLYIDFWDIKQPGIFWLNGVALQFANPELAVMLLDMMAWAITAVLLTRLVERDGGPPSVSIWVPAVVGLLFVAVRPVGAAGQVESFLGVLLASLLSLVIAPRVSGRAWFVFGLVSGLVMLLKLVWLLAPVLLFAVAFMAGPQRLAMSRLRDALQAALPALAGFALVAAAAAATLARTGSLGEALYVTFVYPFIGLDQGTAAPLDRLVAAVAWSAKALAGFAALVLARMMLLRHVRWSRLEWGLLAWIAAACALFLIQRLSWWFYHLLPIWAGVMALGLVAAGRLSAAGRSGNGASWIGTALVVPAVLCFVFFARGWMMERIDGARAGMLLGARDGYRSVMAPAYVAIDREVAQLRDRMGGSLRDICVLGRPYVYFPTQGHCRVAVPASAIGTLSNELWQRWFTDSAAAAPRVIYFETRFASLLESRCAPMLQWLRTDYVPELVGAGGTWYVRAAAAPGVARWPPCRTDAPSRAR